MQERFCNGTDGSARPLEGEEEPAQSALKASFGAVILQIMIIDLVFSLGVEMLNITMRKRRAHKVQLNPPHIPGA
jgi:hypothetical protein